MKPQDTYTFIQIYKHETILLDNCGSPNIPWKLYTEFLKLRHASIRPNVGWLVGLCVEIFVCGNFLGNLQTTVDFTRLYETLLDSRKLQKTFRKTPGKTS